MDAPGWDSLRSTPNIPAKRSWERGDASPGSFSAGPRSGESQPPSHLLHLSGPTHTARRASDTAGQQTGWDASAQTQGWSTKPEPALYGTGSEDSYEAERRQPVASRHAPLGRPDHSAAPFPSQPPWTKYRRENSGSSSQTNFDPPSSNEMMYQGSQDTRRSSYTLAADELGAADPRRLSAKVTLFEQNCDRCILFRPRIKEFISMIQKFETSLGPFGPYQEIHEHCLRQGMVHDEVPNFPEIHRILGLLNEANDLAKNVVQLGPVYLVNVKEGHQHKPLETIKLEHNPPTLERYFSSESEDTSKRRRLGSIDTRGMERQSMHQGRPGDARRHSSSPSAGDRLPPIYFSSTSHMAPESSGFKLPSMNPPPTPGRHIASPPHRSQNSPPSYNMSSPDSSTFPPSSSANKPTQPSHQPLSPALSSSYSSGAVGGAVPSAVATHTATLQHEVSVKAYALQTLQQEHDKLLAALSRSQTRSRALEEKQVVADNEVNVLSEDRNRLMDRIAELEKEVSEVSEARDEYRNAGVKEGKQYVEIVRLASRLELMAAEERKVMAAELAEKERQLMQREGPGTIPVGSVAQQPASRLADEAVLQLNAKCAKYESALKDIRRKGRRIDDIIAELGSAGTDISQCLSGVLGDEPEESIS